MSFRKNSAAALVVCLCLIRPANADEVAAAADHGFQPSPGLLTVMNLGSAGVLGPLFSDEMQGIHQVRLGYLRTLTGYTNSLPEAAPVPKYYENSKAFSAPLVFTKELSSAQGASWLRFTYALTRGYQSPRQPVEDDADITRATLQYLHAPNPASIWGVGLTYEKSEIDDYYHADPNGSFSVTSREAWGVQFLYGLDFKGPWAMTAKAEWQEGKTKFNLEQFVAPGISFPYHYSGLSDDRLYLEAQLIGTYTAESGLAPEGWVFRPTAGITFQRNYIDSAIDNFGGRVSGVNGPRENYGLIFGSVGLEKTMEPTAEWQAMPRIAVGFEHEYVNDLDMYLKEPTYGTIRLGVGITRGKNRVDIEYVGRQGLDGNRREQTIAAVMQFQF